MAAEPRRAPMMSLEELVQKYRCLATDFGKPAPLSAFALTRAEIESLFSSYDEDYHISRFFHFSDVGGQDTFAINSIPATHVSLDPEIQTIL
jgi:hypothetical protein